MPIILRLDRVMADRKMSLNELSEKVGVTNVNLSKIKTGKISAIRFSTLEAICWSISRKKNPDLDFSSPHFVLTTSFQHHYHSPEVRGLA